ncbi:MAG: hypothetical protein IJ733_00290, partial [Lachnospiraceae bacterium]|nr:hypothetical protein [Lachnospiraceae bacterium]
IIPITSYGWKAEKVLSVSNGRRSGGGWRHFFCVQSRGCGRYISGLPVSGFKGLLPCQCKTQCVLRIWQKLYARFRSKQEVFHVIGAGTENPSVELFMKDGGIL